MIKSFSHLIDFFLPRFCSGCKSKLSINENQICNNCIQSIQLASNERIEFEFEKKFGENIVIKDFKSLYVFEKDEALQNIIHSIKYNKKFLSAVQLGFFLGDHLKQNIKYWNIDILIPVPLHSLKKAERGFNQSDYIAKGISKKLNIPVSVKTLKRIVYTESQTMMTLREREENISDAFKVKNKKKISNKNVLLVDDVITTGATVRECGRILIQNGTSSVFACSIAIAE
jgi:ComF family protein